MTDTQLNALCSGLKELLSHDLPEAMRQSAEQVLQIAIDDEATEVIGAGAHERTLTRKNRRNGHRVRKLETQLGQLEVAIPKLRSGSYYPSFLEPHCRIHASLAGIVQEAYVAGVSTRKIEDLAEALGVGSLSKSTASRMLEELDKDVAAFRNRPLGSCPYIFIDARYEKVHEGSAVVSKALYVAVGVTDDGRREALGYTVAASEDAVNWQAFLEELTKRGLRGVRLVVSDAHHGIRRAVEAVFPESDWQRCTIHMGRNLEYAVSKRLRPMLKALFRTVVQADSLETAKQHLVYLRRWLSDEGLEKAERALEEAGEDYLTFYGYPKAHHRKLHSTNLVERLMRELKRRTRVVGIFPSDKSLMRLGGALLRRQHLSWSAETKHYMSLTSMIELTTDDQAAQDLIERYKREDKLLGAA